MEIHFVLRFSIIFCKLLRFFIYPNTPSEIRAIRVIQDIFANLYFWFVLFKNLNHQLQQPHFQCLSSEKSSFSLHEISLTDLIVLLVTSRTNSFQNSSVPFNVGLTQTACALEISVSILTKTLRTLAGHTLTLRIHVAAQADVKRNFKYSGKQLHT